MCLRMVLRPALWKRYGREGGRRGEGARGGVVENEEGRDIANVRDVTLLQIFVQLTEEEAQKQAEGKNHCL